MINNEEHVDVFWGETDDVSVAVLDGPMELTARTPSGTPVSRPPASTDPTGKQNINLCLYLT